MSQPTAWPSNGPMETIRERGHDFYVRRSEGVWLYDEDGRSYLDALAGRNTHNLGHRPPELVEELVAALKETDQGNFPMISIEKSDLAHRLAQFIGHGLECVNFSVTRGETVEFACKIARGVTGRERLVTPEGGWLGETGFAMSLSSRGNTEPFEPLIPEVRKVPFGHIETARAALDRNVAAFVLELVQVENHGERASVEYVQAVAEACRRVGALLVIDETQTGFGRFGERFLFEGCGVVPDMLILGEALGGGMFPIAATVFTPAVNEYLNKHPLIHLSTFGGSDVGCRVARRALDLYDRVRPWDNAKDLGERWSAAARSWPETYRPTVVSISGSGLFLSIALENERRALAFCRALASRGLVAQTGAVNPATVVFRPPLTLASEQLDRMVRITAESLDELHSSR